MVAQALKRYFHLSLTLILISNSLQTKALGEENRAGVLARVVREGVLRLSPSVRGKVLVELSRGDVVILRGERRDDYLAVRMELEGSEVEGWVLSGDLFSEGTSTAATDIVPVDPKKPSPSKRRKMVVPKDEGLLLRREHSFFYGAQASGAFSMIQDTELTSYSGIGLDAGAFAGTFVAHSLPLKLEVNYVLAQAATSDTTGTTALQFGFLFTGLTLQYLIDDFEASMTAGYAFATGVSDVPPSIAFDQVSDLSSFWFGGGLGYRFSLTDYAVFALRGRYLISSMRDPFTLQVISIGAALEFRG